MCICLTQFLKEFSLIITQLVQCNSSYLLYFFPRMFFKLHFFYFVLFAKSYGFCLRAQAVNSDFILNVLETVKFVFCLKIHALAKCTINSKFCILPRRPRAVYKIFRSLYIQLVRVFLNITLTTVSDP